MAQAFMNRHRHSHPHIMPINKGSRLDHGITASLVFALILLVLLFNQRWSGRIAASPVQLPRRSYTFLDHPELRPFDTQTEQRWSELSRTDWYNTHWRSSSGQQLTRGIAMFHKLHCLQSLRSEFTRLVHDPNRHEVFWSASEETTRMHIGHCFDFIRQDILCGADTTLEPLGDDYGATDGLGISHSCTDWSPLTKFMGLHTNI